MSIRGGEARNLIDDFADQQGWNAESKIDLLCDYPLVKLEIHSWNTFYDQVWLRKHGEPDELDEWDAVEIELRQIFAAREHALRQPSPGERALLPLSMAV